MLSPRPSLLSLSKHEERTHKFPMELSLSRFTNSVALV